MTLFRWLTTAALVLCLCVVVLGAYVRLSDAGLGCPDWPGCYGHLTVPTQPERVEAAQQRFPERPLEAPKAWKEMVHRYLASALGLLIIAMALVSRFSRSGGLPRVLPWLLVGLVIFQGILGMWTVTLLLKPLVVTAHLLGGMATLGLLYWVWLGSRDRGPGIRDSGESSGALARRLDPHAAEFRNEREAWAQMSAGDGTAATAPAGLRWLAALALLLLAGQIFLGGWTSSNYAALACPDLPTCQHRWLPELDLGEAFTLWRGLGVNYEYGVLDNRARVTIHFLHRVGALVVSTFLVLLGAWLWRRGGLWKRLAAGIWVTLALQAGIGIAIVLLQLPLLLAAAHNAGAALLLLAVITLNHHAWRRTA
jgi:heme a synthase